jgi:hypothetical protein
VQYTDVSHAVKLIIPALEANLALAVPTSDVHHLQALIDASSGSATQVTQDAPTMDSVPSLLATPVKTDSGPTLAPIPTNSALVQPTSQVALKDDTSGKTSVRPEDFFA